MEENENYLPFFHKSVARQRILRPFLPATPPLAVPPLAVSPHPTFCRVPAPPHKNPFHPFDPCSEKMSHCSIVAL